MFLVRVCRCFHEGTQIWATAVCQMAVQQDCLHDVNSARWVHADCPQTWKRRLKTQLCHRIQQQHGCGGLCRSDAATICHAKDTAVVQKGNAASAASKPVEHRHRLQAYFAVKDGLPHIPVWGHYIASLRRSASTRTAEATQPRTEEVVRLKERHFPHPVPQTQKASRSSRKCTKRGKRKDTSYMCTQCPKQPALCVCILALSCSTPSRISHRHHPWNRPVNKCKYDFVERIQKFCAHSRDLWQCKYWEDLYNNQSTCKLFDHINSALCQTKLLFIGFYEQI